MPKIPHIHVGDVVTLVIDVDHDFSGYDELELKFRRPDGTTFSKKTGDGVAAQGADPTSGVIVYTTAEADINQSGDWKVHPIVYQTATEADPLHGEPAARFNAVAEFAN